MVSPIRCHGLTFGYGELVKPDGVSECWNTSALFNVVDPTNFCISVVVVCKGKGTCSPAYIVGVAPSSTKMSGPDIDDRTGAFAEFSSPGLTKDKPKMGRVVDADWPAETLESHPDARFELSYSQRCIYVSCNGGAQVKVLEDMPPGDYRPCISIGNPGVRLRVSLRESSKKRRLLSSEGGLLKMAKSLWEDKKFADATVVCGEKTVFVHRCILSAASPFFAKAFENGMQETQDKRVVINDIGEEVLDIFLKYFYTRDLPDAVEVDKLLPVAHRYEVIELIMFCAETMADGLCEENVCKYVAAMRPFRFDPSVSDAWERIIERISGNPALVRAHLCG